MLLPRFSRLFVLSALVATAAAHAQSAAPKLDLGVGFTAGRSLKAASGQNFWMEGGNLELGVNLWKGLGIAADVTGLTGSSIGASGIPLSLETTTFGPRYRWTPKNASRHFALSPYGEVLVGEANGFKSYFPVTGAAQDSANGLATRAGGGLDVTLSKHFAVRAVQAFWLRTTLPNATDNVQNTLELGAGIVVKFGG